MLQLKRVYEPVSPDDGYRVLVERLWPRGVSKEEAHLDAWTRDLDPSRELRRWYNHNPDKWDAFRTRTARRSPSRDKNRRSPTCESGRAKGR